jgi:hypothetical protein
MGFWSKAADVGEFILDPKNIGTAAGFVYGGPPGAAAGRALGGSFRGIDLDRDGDIYGQEPRDSILADGITREDFARLGKDALEGYTMGKVGQQVPGIRGLEGAFAGGGTAAAETTAGLGQLGTTGIPPAAGATMPPAAGGAMGTPMNVGGPVPDLGMADIAGTPNPLGPPPTGYGDASHILGEGKMIRPMVPTPGDVPTVPLGVADQVPTSSGLPPEILEMLRKSIEQGDSLTDAYMKIQLASGGLQALGSFANDGSDAAARVFGSELTRADERRRNYGSTYTPYSASSYGRTG